MKLKHVKTLPTNAVTTYDHAAIGSKLRAQPGEWFRIERGPVKKMHALAAKWRNARPAGFGDGVFDFRAVTVEHGSGEAKLFGRYVAD